MPKKKKLRIKINIKNIKKTEKISLKQRLFFVPSLISCGSILCGLWAIFLCITTTNIEAAILLIVLAGILDAFDGRTARFLGVSGKFGIELDSLADFISFGIAPMLIYFCYFNWSEILFSYAILSIFPVCMSLRLARFNTIALEPIKEKKITDFRKNFFFGLAAPIGAIALLLPIITNIINYWGFSNTNYAIAYAFAISLLLVIPVPIFSHKMFHFGFKKKMNTAFTIFALLFAIFLIYNPLHCILIMSAMYCLTIPFSIIIYNKGIAKLESELYYAK
jgi:CDP-diacylglycerol--serine O-phosphatidyltransferase